jgi:hypothetical protein
MKNETVQGTELLLFIYSIVERGVKLATKVKINDEKEKRDYGAAVVPEIQRKSLQEQKDMNYKVEMVWKKSNKALDEKKTREISGRLLATFGLQCLKKALK